MLMVFCVLLIVVPLCLPNNLTSVRTQPSALRCLLPSCARIC